MASATSSAAGSEMIFPARLQLSLQFDSETIHYQDADTKAIFFIEDMADMGPFVPAMECEEKTVVLCQYFARQHAIRFGVPSTEATQATMFEHPGMGNPASGLESLTGPGALKGALKAIVDVHVDNLSGGPGSTEHVVRSLWKVLGSLTSLLEQREDVGRYLARKFHTKAEDRDSVEKEDDASPRLCELAVEPKEYV